MTGSGLASTGTTGRGLIRTARDEALFPDDEVVTGAPWDTFLAYLNANWKPGQHMALIGPTGQGKSTFAVPVIGLRRYVLAMDPKGGDDTLAASGFTRISSWPPPGRIWQDIAEGKPARLILGAKGAGPDELAPEFNRALSDVLAQGGWTCYIDEFQIAADRRMMDVGTQAEKLLISARFKKVSVVTAFQAPSWVPTAGTRQASWIAIWPTKDEDCIKTIAQKAGRPKLQMLEIVKRLPPFHVLVVPPRPDVPMIMTKAPRIS